MSTLSVPLTSQQEEFVGRMVKEGYADNKAAVVRKALRKLAEYQVVTEVLEARQEYRAGQSLTGDLKRILKKFPG